MNGFLSSIQFEGPSVDEHSQSWACVAAGVDPADEQNFYLAVAVTPPVSDAQIKSVIKRKGLY